MAKYLVETYYNCTFKVSHYLDDINEAELKNLEKRDDGKFEILDIKLDNRKTKNLEAKVLDANADKELKKIDIIPQNNSETVSKNNQNLKQNVSQKTHRNTFKMVYSLSPDSQLISLPSFFSNFRHFQRLIAYTLILQILYCKKI